MDYKEFIAVFRIELSPISKELLKCYALWIFQGFSILSVTIPVALIPIVLATHNIIVLHLPICFIPFFRVTHVTKNITDKIIPK